MIKKVRPHINQNEPLLFERSSPGKRGYQLPPLDVPAVDPAAALGAQNTRAEIEDFPEVSEVEAIRHFTRLSTWNYAIDLGLYPLGSCTMKYNPRVNEQVARIEGLAWAHPYQPESLSQGIMEVMAALEQMLAEITGMDAVTLQPAAGRARRIHRHPDGPRAARIARQSAQEAPDSRFGARHQSRHGRPWPATRSRTSSPTTLGMVDVDELARVVDRRCRRADAHQSQHARRFRRAHHAHRGNPARQGRAALHGRRQHERAGRHRASRRFRRRRDAPESAQDVFHSARRRRSGLRSR